MAASAEISGSAVCACPVGSGGAAGSANAGAAGKRQIMTDNIRKDIFFMLFSLGSN
jgi:hypothetical protein